MRLQNCVKLNDHAQFPIRIGSARVNQMLYWIFMKERQLFINKYTHTYIVMRLWIFYARPPQNKSFLSNLHFYNHLIKWANHVEYVFQRSGRITAKWHCLLQFFLLLFTHQIIHFVHLTYILTNHKHFCTQHRKHFIFIKTKFSSWFNKFP